MCLIADLEFHEPRCAEPTRALITATGAHDCVVLHGVVNEYSSMPDRDNYTLKRIYVNELLISLYGRIGRWAKFVYKTKYLQDAVILIEIDDMIVELNGGNMGHELRISEVPGCWQLNFTWKE